MKETTVLVFVLFNLMVIAVACSSLPTANQVTLPTLAPLTADMLKNAEYVLDNSESKIKLVEGKFEEPAAPGSAAKKMAQLSGDTIAFGDLNNDGAQDAAVILFWSGGGSGTFYNVYGVINDKGILKPTAPQSLGDRIKIKSVTIQAGEIVVNFLTRKPDQAMAIEPMVDTMQKFVVQDGKLVLKTP